MRILITGVEGFVGRYLLDEIRNNSSDSIEVFGIGFTEENRVDLGGRCSYTRLDITDFDRFREYLVETNPDIIYHLAAQSSVAVSLKNPEETFRINKMGTLYLLETAVKKLDCRPKILLVGSADIYRAASGGKPMTEDTPIKPMNPYSASKAAVDFLGPLYYKNYGLKVINTRSFNHFGPGQAPIFVMPEFAGKIAEIEQGLIPPVISTGNLNIKRDFTDVRDVVRAYRMLMEKGSPGEVYNVCSGQAVEIAEMLKTLLSMTSAKIEVKTDPEKFRKADNPVLCGDNSKINKQTGWSPEIPVRQTLEALLEYCRKNVRKNNG